MDAYISKPVKPEILGGILTQFITADAGPVADTTATSPDLPATNGAEGSETGSPSHVAHVAQPAQPAEVEEPPHTLNGKVPA